MRLTIIATLILATIGIGSAAFACERIFYVIKYDVGSAEISQRDKTELKQFARTAKHRDQICLFGQADGQGDEEVNERLVRERVEIVRDYLIAHGVPKDRFSLSYQPRAITLWETLNPDNPRERSVTIRY